MEKGIEAKDLLKKQKKENRDARKKIQKEYLSDLRDNPANKRSLWLNFIAFFIPIWGIFAAFAYLVKCPKRAKGLFITSIIAFILQGGIIVFCDMFLFDYLGRICVTMFG